jgi:hypothetical protein
MLEHLQKYELKNGSEITFQITSNNDWTCEFTIEKNNKVVMRFKIYDKTAEKLTSLGCSYNSPGDPLSNLLLIEKLNKKYNIGCEYAR